MRPLLGTRVFKPLVGDRKAACEKGVELSAWSFVPTGGSVVIKGGHRRGCPEVGVNKWWQGVLPGKSRYL